MSFSVVFSPGIWPLFLAYFIFTVIIITSDGNLVLYKAEHKQFPLFGLSVTGSYDNSGCVEGTKQDTKKLDGQEKRKQWKK